MKFFIVDDATAVRTMLADIVEEERLGKVVGEASDGMEVTAAELMNQQVDILLIDLLMVHRSGLETIQEIAPVFPGKIIVISQVESKELIGKAYALGIEHYITKPINRLEVSNILRNVIRRQRMEKSLNTIQNSLGTLNSAILHQEETGTNKQSTYNEVVAVGRNLLFELGIIGENGTKDLLDILCLLYQSEKEGIRKVPPLKRLYEQVVCFRLGTSPEAAMLKRESKACEQRIRRSVHQALEHIASLGLTDHSDPKFEGFASSFFDYNQIREKMLELDGKPTGASSSSKINVKKFILAFYTVVKQDL